MTEAQSVALIGVRNGDATSFAIICDSGGSRVINGSAIQWNILFENGVSAANTTNSPSTIFIARERASSTPASTLRVTRCTFGSISKSLKTRRRAAWAWRRILVEGLEH